MNSKDSGLAHGTSGSPQLTAENMEAEIKAAENELALLRQSTDFYGAPKGKLVPAKYKRWIGVSRRKFYLNKARNKTLWNAVDQYYRPGAFIGDGGTADVIKFELKTGLHLGKNGGTHEKKGRDMINYIQNKILTQNLSNSDRKLANTLIKQLKKALATGVKK